MSMEAPVTIDGQDWRAHLTSHSLPDFETPSQPSHNSVSWFSKDSVKLVWTGLEASARKYCNSLSINLPRCVSLDGQIFCRGTHVIKARGALQRREASCTYGSSVSPSEAGAFLLVLLSSVLR
jgi:hypothetical protein